MSGISSRAGNVSGSPFSNSLDDVYMRLALALGSRGLGQCWPNPSVGAVVAEPANGQILSSGWTARGGRPHAEAIALAEAGYLARGATLYATLEPCSHWGKTPPCADAIIRAGVARVVYGAVDPDPRVAGAGLARLREQGVEVIESSLKREARWLALGHALRVTAQRPFVQMKLAVDAAAHVPAGSGGAPVWVTGETARAYGHMLRAQADAILIGHGTLAADDPELTCRLPGLSARSPVRIVMAGNLDIPLRSKLASSARDVPVWAIGAHDASAENRARLEDAGVRCITAERRYDGRLDIQSALQALASRGVTRLLIEGGPAIANSFHAAGAIDEIVIFQADRCLSGEKLAIFEGRGLDAISTDPRYELVETRPIGSDRMFVYRRKDYWQD